MDRCSSPAFPLVPREAAVRSATPRTHVLTCETSSTTPSPVSPSTSPFGRRLFVSPQPDDSNCSPGRSAQWKQLATSRTQLPCGAVAVATTSPSSRYNPPPIHTPRSPETKKQHVMPPSETRYSPQHGSILAASVTPRVYNSTVQQSTPRDTTSRVEPSGSSATKVPRGSPVAATMYCQQRPQQQPVVTTPRSARRSVNALLNTGSPSTTVRRDVPRLTIPQSVLSHAQPTGSTRNSETHRPTVTYREPRPRSSWQPPRPLLQTARAHYVNRPEASDITAAPKTERGSKNVLGKIFESLKTSLGIQLGPPRSSRETTGSPYNCITPQRTTLPTAVTSPSIGSQHGSTEPLSEAPGPALQQKLPQHYPAGAIYLPTPKKSVERKGVGSTSRLPIQQDAVNTTSGAEQDVARVGSLKSKVPTTADVAETVPPAQKTMKKRSTSGEKTKLPRLNLSALSKTFSDEDHVISPQTAASTISPSQYFSVAEVSPLSPPDDTASSPTQALEPESSRHLRTPATQATATNSTVYALELSPEKPEAHTVASIVSHTSGVPTSPKTIRFSWLVARALIKLQMQPAESFSLNGVPWSMWDLHQIPTLGASPTSCRVQEMYKATILPESPSGRKLRVFVKAIPASVWKKQWESQNKWGGDYVTDGENFVMEAAALAFLQQYGPHLAPRLLGILELNTPLRGSPQKQYSHQGRHHRENKDVTHVVIVSELYGEDLLDFLEKREKDKMPLTEHEKMTLQFDCLCLLNRLHNLGLAHLDFTPENILYGRRGLRLCDFAKATPLYTTNFRHTLNKETPWNGSHFPFESCEPTVGKGAYMPPECWSVYWRLEDTRIQYPLEELWTLAKPGERAGYYFRVDAADVYMAGVLLFWLWSEGGIWKCSDIKQDEKYHHLVRSGLNFDLFRECRAWPPLLKDMLQSALQPDPKRRADLNDVMAHQWFDSLKAVTARDRRPKLSLHGLSRPETVRAEARPHPQSHRVQ